MKPLTEQVHDLLSEFPLSGETVIDATAGNGFDTLFLSRCVGPEGKVFAIDIQQQAIDKTKQRLAQAGCNNVICLQGSHAEMARLLPENMTGKIAAITFNLGYLPGGNKTITTEIETTLAALEFSLELLKPGGILTVIAYTGHPGGKQEADSVFDYASRLPVSQFKFSEQTPGSPAINTPRIYVIQKAARGTSPEKPEETPSYLR